MKFRNLSVFFATVLVAVVVMCCSVSAAGTQKVSSVDDINYSTDGWAQVGNDYYYVKSGELIEDSWFVLGGKHYYFDYDGKMYSNKIDYIENSDGSGYDHYCFDKSGCMVTGWYKDDQGDYYYCDSEGKVLEDQLVVQGSKKYYLDYDGKMLVDETHDVYNDTTKDYDWYHFGKDGSAVSGWLEEFDDEYRYYGTDGKDFVGVHTIGGVQYYFTDDGWLSNFGYYYDGSKIYEVNSKGVVTSSADATKNGWIKLDKEYFYAQNGKLLINSWLNLNNKYYYFDNQGRMYSNGEYGIYNEKEDKFDDYFFDKNGCMLTGWHCGDSGFWLYYDNNGKSHEGELNLAGKTYIIPGYCGMAYNEAVLYNGILYITDKNGVVTKKCNPKTQGWISAYGHWYYSDGQKFVKNQVARIGGIDYYFWEDGMLATQATNEYAGSGKYVSTNNNGCVVKNNWSSLKYAPYVKYYSDNNGNVVKSKWEKINNSWYYLDDNGVMATDLMEVDNAYQLFGEDGKWKGKAYYKTGWNLIAGYYYYIENNKAVTGWKKIGSAYYYFDKNGEMIRDLTWSIGDKIYAFDKNGHLLTSAWVEGNRSERYGRTDASGVLLKGWQKIGSVWYYFDNYGKLETENFVLDGKIQCVNSNGAYQKAVNIDSANGWYKIYGRYYYYKNGEILTGWQYIGKNSYYFTDYGEMISDEVIHTNGKYYYVNTNGAWVDTTGWVSNGQYYLKNGEAVIGWQKINNKWYYFEWSKISSCVKKIDGTYYRFNKDGVEIGTYNVKNGWQQVDGYWYYGINGDLVIYDYLELGGQHYAFDTDGKMITNFKHNNIIFGANGAVIKNQWMKLGGYWYYSDPLGRVYMREIRVIGGKTYTFDRYGRMM